MLKGGYFDFDRHGAQQRIAGSDITMFDHGCLMFDPDTKKVIIPTKEDRQTMGSIILESFRDNKKDCTPVVEALINRMNDASAYGSSADYVVAFKRGLLALNDYKEHMGSTEEERNHAIQQAITTIIKTGMSSPDITAPLVAEILQSGETRLTDSFNDDRIILKDKHAPWTKKVFNMLSTSLKSFGAERKNECPAI